MFTGTTIGTTTVGNQTLETERTYNFTYRTKLAWCWLSSMANSVLMWCLRLGQL